MSYVYRQYSISFYSISFYSIVFLIAVNLRHMYLLVWFRPWKVRMCAEHCTNHLFWIQHMPKATSITNSASCCWIWNSKKTSCTWWQQAFSEWQACKGRHNVCWHIYIRESLQVLDFTLVLSCGVGLDHVKQLKSILLWQQFIHLCYIPVECLQLVRQRWVAVTLQSTAP